MKKTIRTLLALDIVPSDVSDLIESHIRITWYITFLMVLVCLAWIGAGAALKEPIVFGLGLSMLAAIFATQAFFVLGKHVIARIWLYLSANFAVTFACIVLPPDTWPEAMYLILIGAPFLNFSVAREGRIIAWLVAGTVFLLILEITAGRVFAFDPWIRDLAVLDIIGPSVLTMVIFIVGFEMAMFGILANSYQERLRVARLKAEEASRAKGDFLAAMSHEIRTPMNGIIGMVDVLEKSHLTSEQERLVDTVRDSSIALLRIIEDILDTSRIEAGKLQLHNEETELVPLFERSVETLRSYAISHHVTLELYVDPSLPRFASCDPGRVRQIVLNLLSNAIKFSGRSDSRAGGNCCVTIERSASNMIEMVVEDDGIGIEEKFLKRLFQPFEQQFGASNRFGGSGLGLAIVRQLVEKMEGEISVKSKLGQGTEFTVRLPIIEPREICACPDLTGMIVTVLDSSKRAPVWQRYVTQFGGQFEQVCDPQQIGRLAEKQDDNRVFLLPISHPEAPRPTETCRDAWDLPNDARAIFLASEEAQLLPAQAGAEYLLQTSPLLPSNLFETIDEIRRSGPVKRQESRGGKVQESLLEPPRKRAHILVAEDNEINQLVLRTQLEKLGYTTTLVADGAAALDAIKRGGFDLLLTDCQMPKLDGFQLTAAIRNGERSSPEALRFPIIALTANALEGEEERCLEAGMDDYLSKPVTLDMLEKTIQRRLALSEKDKESR